MENTRKLSVIAITAVAACAFIGCTSHVEYVEGEVLKTEKQEVRKKVLHKLDHTRRLDAASPFLKIGVQARQETMREHRDICQKVEVYKKSTWFQPDSFLWLVNFTRGTLWLGGSAGAGGIMLFHAAAAPVVGIGGAAVGGVAIPGMILATPEKKDRDPLGFMETCAGGLEAVLETPFQLLELPQILAYDAPMYPFTKAFIKHEASPWGRKLFTNDYVKEWWEADKKLFEDLWYFGWDYKAYSPFFIWPKTKSAERRILPGETIPGEWKTETERTQWTNVPYQPIRLKGPTVDKTITSDADGFATIQLLPLAQGLRHTDAFTFTVEANTETGTLAKLFTFKVSDLRDPQPPMVSTIPRNGAIVKDPVIVLQVTVIGDDTLTRIIITHDGLPVAEYPKAGGKLDYHHEVKEKLSLKPGENTIKITVEDKNGRRREEPITIHLQ
jgi:hypothetical protein